MPTAILIDGEFFLHRFRNRFGLQTPAFTAKQLHRLSLDHLNQKAGRRELYRIFYYDCPPLSKKVHNPVSGRAIDFSKTEVAIWRNTFHDELKRLRKVALRLGHVNENSGHWIIQPSKVKALLQNQISTQQLTENDVRYDIQQKGVDMKIGLDIASLAYKKLANQIILISGDSDFVPAAKLARREGIDFVLDPLGASIRPDLFEHIDGLRTIWGANSELSKLDAQPSENGLVDI